MCGAVTMMMTVEITVMRLTAVMLCARKGTSSVSLAAVSLCPGNVTETRTVDSMTTVMSQRRSVVSLCPYLHIV